MHKSAIHRTSSAKKSEAVVTSLTVSSPKLSERRAAKTSTTASITPTRQPDSLTALPITIDVAALAQLYNSPPSSHVLREDLLEAARTALMKYELAEADMEIAADSLARAMHLLLEQHGLAKLEPHHMAELERDVLNWCGLCVPQLDSGDEAAANTPMAKQGAAPVDPSSKSVDNNASAVDAKTSVATTPAHKRHGKART